MKSIFSSKTFWWNVISFVIAALALPEFSSVIPATWLPAIGTVSAIGNVVLRMITTQPVSVL